MILSPEFTKIRAFVGSASRKATLSGRAWLISPQGEVYSCGLIHKDCALNKNLFNIARKIEPKIDKSDVVELLLNVGWARIGLLSTFGTQAYLYIDCNKLTAKYFDVLQDIAIHTNPTEVQVSIGDKVIDFSRPEFLEFESPSEVNRHLLNVGRKRFASLPKSRNFLVGVSLEEMPWPLRQAFDLLNLSEKKDRLSANQVVSVFQAHDEFLQDHLGRTSTELIRDLNGFFQYGQLKKQIA